VAQDETLLVKNVQPDGLFRGGRIFMFERCMHLHTHHTAIDRRMKMLKPMPRGHMGG
jgi:hypothetical protein